MSINQYTNGNKRLDFYCDNLNAEFLKLDNLDVENLTVGTITSGSYSTIPEGSFSLDQTGLQVNDLFTSKKIVNSGEIVASDTANIDTTIKTDNIQTDSGIWSKYNLSLNGSIVTNYLFPFLNVYLPTRTDEWTYKISSNFVGPFGKTMINIKTRGWFTRRLYQGKELIVIVATAGEALLDDSKLASIKGSANPTQATGLNPYQDIKHSIMLPLSNVEFLDSNTFKVRFKHVNGALWRDPFVGQIDNIEINLDINFITNF